MTQFHWTPHRKAQIVEQIRDGRLAEETALRLYGLSPEELAAWRRDYEAHGEPGLRTMLLQKYNNRRLKRK